MTLYEIDQEILSLIDPETGEIQDYAMFEQLQMDRNRKIENAALLIKNYSAEATAIKEEVGKLTSRQRQAEKNMDRLKEYLTQALDGQKFHTPRCVVSFRKKTSVQVENEREFIQWAEQNGREDCIRRGKPEISKSQVASLLKNGAELPYVRLTEGQSVGVK